MPRFNWNKPSFDNANINHCIIRAANSNTIPYTDLKKQWVTNKPSYFNEGWDLSDAYIKCKVELILGFVQLAQNHSSHLPDIHINSKMLRDVSAKNDEELRSDIATANASQVMTNPHFYIILIDQITSRVLLSLWNPDLG